MIINIKMLSVSDWMQFVQAFVKILKEFFYVNGVNDLNHLWFVQICTIFPYFFQEITNASSFFHLIFFFTGYHL